MKNCLMEMCYIFCAIPPSVTYSKNYYICASYRKRGQYNIVDESVSLLSLTENLANSFSTGIVTLASSVWLYVAWLNAPHIYHSGVGYCNVCLCLGHARTFCQIDDSTPHFLLFCIVPQRSRSGLLLPVL